MKTELWDRLTSQASAMSQHQAYQRPSLKRRWPVPKEQHPRLSHDLTCAPKQAHIHQERKKGKEGRNYDSSHTSQQDTCGLHSECIKNLWRI